MNGKKDCKSFIVTVYLCKKVKCTYAHIWITLFVLVCSKPCVNNVPNKSPHQLILSATRLDNEKELTAFNLRIAILKIIHEREVHPRLYHNIVTQFHLQGARFLTESLGLL